MAAKINQGKQMFERLIEIMEKQVVASLFVNGNNSAFYCGRIDAMDKKYIRIKCLSNEGHWLGYNVVRHNMISRIETETLHQKKIFHLSRGVANCYQEFHIQNYEENDESVIYPLFKASKKEKHLLTIGVDKDFLNEIIGRVVDFNNDAVTVDVFDEFGRKIENAVLQVSDIFSIGVFDKELQQLEYLLMSDFPASLSSK